MNTRSHEDGANAVPAAPVPDELVDVNDAPDVQQEDDMREHPLGPAGARLPLDP